MPETTCAVRAAKKMSLAHSLGICILLTVCGAILPIDILLGTLSTLLASLALALLCRRAALPFSIIGAFLYAVASVLASGRAEALILSLAAVAGGFLLSHSVERGDSRVTMILNLSAAHLLVLIALGVYSLLLAAEKAGATDPALYLSDMLDQFALTLASLMRQSLDVAAETYAQMGVEVVLPTEGELHTLILQLMSLVPGLLFLFVGAFSLVQTYLLQLTALLFPAGGNRAPLFRQENRVYRFGLPFAVTYLVVWIVSSSWVDYASVISLVFQNTALVMTPAMAFGGVLGLPALFRLMRRAEEGRMSYVFWIVTFLMLCLWYIQYAVMLFALAYTIYILYDAFHSRRKNED